MQGLFSQLNVSLRGGKVIKRSGNFFLLFPLLLATPHFTPSTNVQVPRSVQERAYNSLQFREFQSQNLSPTVARPAPLAEIETPQKSQAVIETYLCETGHWRIAICFPEPVTYTQEKDCSSLLLEFNQSVDSPGLLDAQEKTAYVINRFATGFRSLYLEARRPLTFVTFAEGNMFYIDIDPNYCDDPPMTRELKLSVARLLIEDRCYLAAFSALHRFLDEYPEDRDALVLLAGLETLLPRWQNAVHILQHVRERQPWDMEVRRYLCDIFCPHSSFVRYERQLQRTHDFAAEQINRLQAEWIIGCSDCNYLYAGGIFAIERGHLSSVVNDVGDSVGFLGTRYQGGLYLRNERSSGFTTIGRLWMTEGVVFGAGAEVSWLTPLIQGDIGFIADWHKPYWDLFETLAHFGREDRLRIRFNSVYNRYINWNFAGGIHRVGIDGVPNGFTAFQVNSNCFYYLTVRNPNVALNYGLDSEWIIHHDVKTGPTGNEFQPVPLTSYEFHSVRVYIFYEWRDRWFLTLFGGGTFNRLGTNAPTGGVTLRYMKPCPCGWDVELSAINYPSAQVTGAETQYYTATITVRF